MLLMGSRAQEGGEPYVRGSTLLPVIGSKNVPQRQRDFQYEGFHFLHSKVRGMVKGT